jgi:Family of unknown function (DUF5519)
MARLVKKLIEKISAWPNVSVHPHQFLAQEFRFGKAEIGHVHSWGVVDIPFTRAIRDYLIENQFAQQHHWLPDSGWTMFCMWSTKDLEHALWLMRISYLRYALRSHSDASALLKTESQRIHLQPELTGLLGNV